MNNFKGIVNEYPFVAIDYFKGKCIASDICVYMLSHCHRGSDDGGLGSSEFLAVLQSRKNVHLYCAFETACLLKNDEKYKHLTPYLVSLDYNERKDITVSTPDSLKTVELTVTFMPSGHCIGSTMILLEGIPGAILYAANIRIPVGETQTFPPLHTDTNQVKQLKSMYLDTTFCRPSACYIPSLLDSVTSCVNIIRPWLDKSPDNCVSILCPVQHGYEQLFCGLCKQLGMRVYVGTEMFSKYEGLAEVQESLTNELNESRITVCTQKEDLHCSTLQNVLSDNGSSERHTESLLKIKLIEMCFTTPTSNIEVSRCVSDNLYHVCYVTHSSLQELQDMVAYLKPENIYPSVNETDCAEQVVKWLRMSQDTTSGEAEEELEDYGCTNNKVSDSPACILSPENTALNSMNGTECEEELLGNSQEDRLLYDSSEERLDQKENDEVPEVQIHEVSNDMQSVQESEQLDSPEIIPSDVFLSQNSNKLSVNTEASDKITIDGTGTDVEGTPSSPSVETNHAVHVSSNQELLSRATEAIVEEDSPGVSIRDPYLSSSLASPSANTNQNNSDDLEPNNKMPSYNKFDCDDHVLEECLQPSHDVILEDNVIDSSPLISKTTENNFSEWDLKLSSSEVVDVNENSSHCPDMESELENAPGNIVHDIDSHSGPAISEIPESEQNDCSNADSELLATQNSPKEIDVITYSSADDNSLLSSSSEIDVETVTRKETESCIKPIITYPEDDSASADEAIPVANDGKNSYSTSMLNVNSDNISSMVRLRTEVQTRNGPQSIIDLSDDIEVVHEVTVNNHISGVIGLSSQIYHFNIVNQGRAPEVFFDAPSSSSSHTVVTSTESNYTILKRTSSLDECSSQNSYKRRHCFTEEYEQACILLDCPQTQKITELDTSDDKYTRSHLNITSDSSSSSDRFKIMDSEMQNGGSTNASYVDSKAQKRKWNDSRSSSEVLCLTSSSSSEDLDVVGNGSSQLDVSDNSSKDSIELIELDDESNSLPKIEANGTAHKDSSDEEVIVHNFPSFECSKQSNANLGTDSESATHNVVNLRDKQNNRCVLPRKIVKEDMASVEIITIDD